MDQIELIEEFKKDLKRRDLSSDTQKLYPLYIKAFYRFSGNLLEIDDHILSDYLDFLRAKNNKQSSIIRYYNALSTFYQFLIRKKYISTINPIPDFREYYLKGKKRHNTSQRRKIITLDEACRFVQTILEPQPLAIVVLLLKTGLRRKEVCSLNISSLDMENMTIKVPPTGKRSNEIILFDDETKYVLEEWIRRRSKYARNDCPSLFLDKWGNRIGLNSFDRLFKKYAVAAGLHTGDELENAFTPHCCRHFFSTQLRDRGMPREYIQELRGDSSQQAIDIYYHIDPKKLRGSYDACMPDFGLR
jgi:integrase/recombinase XerD